ncbi:hypothetical protein SAMN05421759_101640 [Roseivivax lentus]|uniref:Uncharacterized protein n=1 Tax=Roseivivax lentus TaxID=633194 RepID=A0A1N7KCQ9_9RHOB|nr:hypothetical protein [Roseivivax lentus]SIS59396.1 hypothetical protein SAMN05421759_101640 [Roseivivax lentus]
MVRLIAETDENGSVVWVWVQREKTSKARPIRDAEAHGALLEQASLYGAPEQEFRLWFDRRAH